MLGIMLGVATLIVVLAVMTGFQRELRERILAVASHLEVVALDDAAFVDWRRPAEQYLEHPQVLAAAPNISAQALITRGARARGAFVKGVLPAEERKVGAWSAFDNADADAAEHPAAVMEKLTPGGYGVVLGATLAERLKVGVGDIVVLISPEAARARSACCRVCAFHRRRFVRFGFVRIRRQFRLYSFRGRARAFAAAGATSIRLRLADLFAAPAVARDVADLRADAALYDWTRSHQGLFRALAVEKRVMFIILSLIVAVAAFNIVSALVTMTSQQEPRYRHFARDGRDHRRNRALVFFAGNRHRRRGARFWAWRSACRWLGTPGALFCFWNRNLGLSLFPGDVYQLGALPSRVLPGEAAGAALFAF